MSLPPAKKTKPLPLPFSSTCIQAKPKPTCSDFSCLSSTLLVRHLLVWNSRSRMEATPFQPAAKTNLHPFEQNLVALIPNVDYKKLHRKYRPYTAIQCFNRLQPFNDEPAQRLDLHFATANQETASTP
ncbi:hypothetical protein LXL04_021384 [Taraxacum kok-saghyz]